MLTLALETSSVAVSAALCRDGEPIGIYYQNCGLTHSRTLLPMIDALLSNCDIKISGIDTIAVAVGPGSFTGLRIGISTAKGLAWPEDKPCAGVSTLLAAAYCHTAHEGMIVPVMDARRQQVYTSSFLCRSGYIKRLSEDRATDISELQRAICEYAEPVLLCGDGAHLINACTENIRAAPPNTRMQNAFGVALAAFRENRTISASDLVPHYLRLPQAERERIESEKNRRGR